MATETKDLQKPPVVVAAREWEELSSILKAYLPGRRVWAFGSRATGRRVKRYSDLDLLIDGKTLSLKEAAMLDEALDESRLPFKVDVVGLETVTPEFRSRIQRDLVVVQEPNLDAIAR